MVLSRLQLSALEHYGTIHFRASTNVSVFTVAGILEAAENLSYEVASICSFCSRMKRGRIYHAARREQYNVLALGQHLDDFSERCLLQALSNRLIVVWQIFQPAKIVFFAKFTGSAFVCICSFLMSVFQNGALRTMKASYAVQ